MTDFQDDLKELINMHCVENESNTPDFILAKYLVSCLSAFEHATQEREDWYGRNETTNPPPTLPPIHTLNTGNDRACSINALRGMLSFHLEKGDMVDVMNLAAMIYVRGIADRAPD